MVTYKSFLKEGTVSADIAGTGDGLAKGSKCPKCKMQKEKCKCKGKLDIAENKLDDACSDVQEALGRLQDVTKSNRIIHAINDRFDILDTDC